MTESAAEATLKLCRQQMCISRHNTGEALCILGTAKMLITYSEITQKLQVYVVAGEVQILWEETGWEALI